MKKSMAVIAMTILSFVGALTTHSAYGTCYVEDSFICYTFNQKACTKILSCGERDVIASATVYKYPARIRNEGDGFGVDWIYSHAPCQVTGTYVDCYNVQQTYTCSQSTTYWALDFEFGHDCP